MSARSGPDRPRTIRGLLSEYESFADLLEAIDTSAWVRPTRCTGWQVRDVAGHVVGQASTSPAGR
ncbi:maleylpyruvate isomerase N-terminal domain-containing protein [uncultured Mycobacterium sp.]|uniref:maleylpyruvate isomerase N-terminal domain-containing protein n=1 Tax=uncultured Mycobacterium sp. TaxID=171292 RepID=UPI0035C9C7EB